LLKLDSAQVKETLAAYPVRHLPAEGRNLAAVLVPFFSRNGEDYLLFTRRTENLNHHRGEISFPGGEREPSDTDLCATALRETEEEIGLRPEDVQILGRLDDFRTLYGFHVTPYVGTFDYPYPFRVNGSEVAEILEIPLKQLIDPAIFNCEDRVMEGRSHRLCFFTFDSLVIWGLTGGILRQFLDRMAGHSSR
jgi:8-oxo-dGTP pyrophosphatase MutT (NUDIX family)